MASKLNFDPLAPDYWELGCLHLANLDERWAALIHQFPHRALRSRGEPFYTLARSIVGQQISTSAADAVWGRVSSLFDEVSFTPQAVINCDDERLREMGLSRAKVQYFKSLAEFANDGQLADDLMISLSDQEVIKHLCQVKGIGEWTAQMFLLFGLRRPDIWPHADLGIQKGIQRQFCHDVNVGAKEALQFGEKLRPWRSVAAWYLWRSLDPEVVDY